LEWSDAGIEGAIRFLRRLWRFGYQHFSLGACDRLDLASLTVTQQGLRRKIHQAIKQAHFDISQQQKFNTAIAQTMGLLNYLEKAESQTSNDRALLQEGLEAILLILAPITPHICGYIWDKLGKGVQIIDQSFPQVDESALRSDRITYVVQVNGKLRAKVELAADIDVQAVQTEALNHSKIKNFLADLTVRKVIVVPNKLINIVAS